MFRPMIYAPMRSPKRLAKSLSGPVVPPVFPFISRNARVPMYQPCSSSPPTPSGSFSPWRGAGAVPVERDREVVDAQLGHGILLWFSYASNGPSQNRQAKDVVGPQTRTSNNGKRKGRTEGGTTPDKEKCEPTGAQRRRSGRGGVGWGSAGASTPCDSLGRRMTRALARHPPVRPLTYLHLPQRLESYAHLIHQKLRLFPRRKVPAF